MDWKQIARYINYNFVAQAVMSALSGVNTKPTGIYSINFINHYKKVHRAKITKKTIKGKDSFVMEIPVYKQSQYGDRADKIIVTLTPFAVGASYNCTVTIKKGSQIVMSLYKGATPTNLKSYLHNTLKNYLKPDLVIGNVHQQYIGALPVGLKFKMNDVQFTVGFQYQIDGKLMLDLQTSSGVSGLFDLLTRNGQEAAQGFIAANANIAFDDKESRKRIKALISEIAKEVKAATPAIKKQKPRIKLKNQGERAPGADGPEPSSLYQYYKTPPTVKRRIIKNKPKPPVPPVPPVVEKTTRPTKTSRMNKRGFDVVEKRSITYTRKSPSKKIAGIGSFTFNKFVDLADQRRFKYKFSDLDKFLEFLILNEKKLFGRQITNLHWFTILDKYPSLIDVMSYSKLDTDPLEDEATANKYWKKIVSRVKKQITEQKKNLAKYEKDYKSGKLGTMKYIPNAVPVNDWKSFSAYVSQRFNQYPHLKEDILDLWQLAKDEIEEGGSVQNEISHGYNSIEELIQENLGIGKAKTVKKPSAKQLAARKKFTAMVRARAKASKKPKIGLTYKTQKEKIVGKVAPNWWAGLGKVPAKGKVNFLLMPTDRTAKKVEQFTAMSYVPRVKLTVARGKNFPKLPKVNNPDDCAAAIRRFFTTNQLTTQEYGGAIYFDHAGNVLGCYIGFVGGITSAVIDVRLMLGVALELGATQIILFHNHPSGTLRASDADIDFTKKVRKAADPLNITVSDHLILTAKSFYSLRENREM